MIELKAAPKKVEVGAVEGLLMPVVLFTGFIFLPLWTVNRPPLNMARLELLMINMSKTEVSDLIGRPKENEFPVRTWSYSRRGAWPVLYIYFDEFGKYQGYEYDR